MPDGDTLDVNCTSRYLQLHSDTWSSKIGHDTKWCNSVSMHHVSIDLQCMSFAAHNVAAQWSEF